MWTTLDVNRQALRKVYTKEYDRAKAFLDKCDEPDNWKVKYKDGSLSAFNSLVYLIARSARPDIEVAIAESIKLKEAEKLSEFIQIRKRQSKFKGSATYVKSREDESKVSKSIIVGMGDNPLFLYLYNVISSLAESSSPVISDLMIEALLLASANLTTKHLITTPTLIQSAIYIYWFFSNICLIKPKIGAKLDPNIEMIRSILPDGTVDTYIKKLIDNNEIYKMVEQYIDDMYNGQMPTEAYFNNIELFADIVKHTIKKNASIKEHFERIENDVRNNECGCLHPAICKLIGKKNAKMAASVIISASYISDRNMRVHCGEPVLLYIIKQVEDKGNTSIISQNNLQNLKFWSEEHSEYICMLSEFSVSTWGYWVIPSLIKEMDKLNKQIESAEKRAESAEKKAVELRKQSRDSFKDVKRLTQENARLQSKVDDLKKTVECNIKPAELQKVQSKLDSCEQQNGVLQADLNDKDRQLSKKDREIEDLKDKIDKQEDSYLELLEKYDREKELNSQMSIHRVFNEIPIQCFINAIKHKKIMLIGGDMMHEKIRLYGIDNITLCKAGCKDIHAEDLINKDLVVMATAFLDHSTSEVIPRIAKQNNIPLMQFNNKNADMLIYALFEELTK